jgi:hypothetical protein
MFVIDTILDHRVKSKGRTLERQYLIKWTGYGAEHNSWEPEEEVSRTVYFKNYWRHLRCSPPSLIQLRAIKRLELRSTRTAH